MEEELRIAQEYAYNLINSSLDMIISVDQDGRIIEFNRAAQEAFGYSKAEILGRHLCQEGGNHSQHCDPPNFVSQ